MSRLRQVMGQVLITIIIAWDATTILHSVSALADTIIILDLMDDLTRACFTEK